MSFARIKCSLLAALTLASVGTAKAADYPQPAPVVMPQPVEFASAWYLRGFIGMSTQSVGSLSNANYANFVSVQNVNKGFDSAPFFGAGIGYTFNNWFRADVTAEYRGKANFHGFDQGFSTFIGGFSDDRYTASKSELTFLFNGFIDLGTWWCLTPFVGAGIGFSRNTISDFGDISTRFSSDVFGGTASQWSFAWALYAGLSYQVTRDVAIELAYRYIDLGNATSGPLLGFDNSVNTPYTFNHITSHDLMLGLRFNLNGVESVRYAAPSVYVPPPVYTQPPVYAPPPLQSRG